MKKTFRGLLLSAVLFLAFVLTSCVSVCQHVPGASWRADAENHWKICDACQQQVETEAHTYGEWEVVSQAAVGVEGKEVRKCSVCRFYEERAIPAIVVETGVATGDTAVYAQVPADWTTVNCYFFGEDKTALDLTVGWPGAPMTLVDAETNTWGYIVPENTGYVIFNNGSQQTIDLLFATTLNYYKLSELDAEGKYLADYDLYTPAADEPELNKYPSDVVIEPETFRTIYVQLPATWAAHNIHYWGKVGSAWPGEEMTLVDAEKNIYSFELSSKVDGFLFGEGDGLDQTGDIIPNASINGYIVVPADGKDTVTEHVYADGVFAEPKVTYYAKLPADWASQKAYWWGTSDAPANWPGVDMTLVDAENNIYSIDVVAAVSVLIFSNNAGDQTVNLSVKAGANAFVVVPQSGQDTADYYVYADGALTPFVETEPQDIVLYVKGTMNGWSDNADYQLAVENNVATITITLNEGDEFKVATSSWSPEFGASSVADGVHFGGDNNIVVLMSGTYVITVNNCNDDTRSITIVLAE